MPVRGEGECVNGHRRNVNLEADAGVCTYLDNLETHFAHRVRLVDLIWAETPVICTEGDLVAEMVRDVTGSTADVRFEPARSGEVYKSRADISKIRRVMGFDPRVPVREGLARTADWYRAHWLPSLA